MLRVVVVGLVEAARGTLAVSARSSSSERRSISGSNAPTSGTIDSSELELAASPAWRILLNRPMEAPSVAAIRGLRPPADTVRGLRSWQDPAVTVTPELDADAEPPVAGAEPDAGDRMGVEPPAPTRAAADPVRGCSGAMVVGWSVALLVLV